MTPRPTIDEVAMMLADREQLSSHTLAAEARIARRTASMWIARLRAAGRIVRVGTAPLRAGRAKAAVRYGRGDG